MESQRIQIFKTALEVRHDAFALPVAIARGFGPLGSAQFRRQLLLILLFVALGTAGVGFGLGALARFGDARGDLVFGWRSLFGHGAILH